MKDEPAHVGLPTDVEQVFGGVDDRREDLLGGEFITVDGKDEVGFLRIGIFLQGRLRRRALDERLEGEKDEDRVGVLPADPFGVDDGQARIVEEEDRRLIGRNR